MNAVIEALRKRAGDIQSYCDNKHPRFWQLFTKSYLDSLYTLSMEFENLAFQIAVELDKEKKNA